MLGYIIYKLKIKNIFLVVVALATFFYGIQFVYLSLIKDDARYPIIIWWTPFMGENERLITCSSKYKCLLTQDRNYTDNTNLKAFLFYGSMFDYHDLPVRKNKIWAIFHEESPRNLAIFLYQRTFDLFDFTATFSRNSDFPLTLQYLKNIDTITDTRHMLTVRQKNKFLSNKAPVLYIQSDCDTPVDRDSYIVELMKYIQVDSYGVCLNNKKFPEEVASINAMDLYNDKFIQFIATYKFVIAFENAVCEDYITEKLWRPLIAGSVPIYLGSPSVKNWLPNENSAILAQEFPTPHKLAEYITKINKNDTLYESFREHKYGKVANELLKDVLNKGPFGIKTDEDHPIPGFECFVCQNIYESVKQERSGLVYDCLKPSEGNSWEYFWQSGDCQSKQLVELVRNNVSFETPC